ncbi:MAG: zinc ribbon domain-containing protein [Candidatus Acidiferrales bacterium]
MSFRKELRVIPRTAWIIAFACYAGLVILIHFVMYSDKGPQGMATWPLAGQLAFNFLIPVILLIHILLCGYIYGDAKRRGMRYVMWTLLAIFVPDLIGVILYFILRDPVPSECPACHNLVLAKFTFCPQCGASVRPVCPQCGKTLDLGWTNCGYCGTKVPMHV